MELAIVGVTLLINVLAGVAGTQNSKIVPRVNLFLAGALSLQLIYLLIGVV